MTDLRPDLQTGSARITGATGDFVFNTGNVAACLRTGVGVYEITLSPGCSPLQHVYRWSPILATADDTGMNLETVSASLVRLRSVAIVAGAVVPFDLDFFFELERVR